MGLIVILLIAIIPIAIWTFIIRKIIDYAAKKFAEEFDKVLRNRL